MTSMSQFRFVARHQKYVLGCVNSNVKGRYMRVLEIQAGMLQ